MKSTLFSLPALLLLCTFVSVSCKKNKDVNSYDNSKTYQLSGYASGAQVVPAVSNSASAHIDGKYNAATNTLQYSLTWAGLSGNPTGMHFHGPAVGTINAGITAQITNYTSAISGVVSNSIKLTDAQEADLINGRWYYDIHTQNNQNGELRGQVIVQ